LGGEKLHQFYKYFLSAVLCFSTGLCIGNLNQLSAQTPDAAGDGSALTEEPSAQAGDTVSGADDFVFRWDAEPDQTLPAPTPTIFVVLRMVLVLALAALAIYGVVFLFKRLSHPPEQKNSYLKVLASAPLSTSSSVSVVALGNNAWLVGAGTGAGSGGVSLIAEITDREIVDAMLLEDSRREPGGGSKLLDFSAILRRLGGGSGVPADKRFSAEDLRKRRERLKNL
jgi:flagellar protein FliO/FliZ